MHVPVASVTFIITHLALGLAVYQDSSSAPSSTLHASVGSIKIGKCCESNELMLDRRCTPIRETKTETKAWRPEFTDEHGHRLTTEPKFQLEFGMPKCKSTEKQWDIFHAPKLNMDLLMILPSGKLRHCTRCGQGESDGDEAAPMGSEIDDGTKDAGDKFCYDHEFGNYCADKIILTNNDSSKVYARVCLPAKEHVMPTEDLMRRVVEPVFRAISIACYLVVAVVYCVLPQLRNLIGNIVTSMTLCLVASQCADLVRIFTEFSSHVSFMVADTVTYVSLLSAFFWLNSLGYYIWKTFSSRNIFLRVTDGRKYCYYSIYVWSSTAAMTAMAIFAHFVLDTNKPTVGGNLNAPQETIGWLGIAVFFTPVAFTIVINLWFVTTTVKSIRRMNTYGRIHHKMKYSFRMFVFLFAIMGIAWLFTLLSWIRHELLYCQMVVNLLQAVLILYVCVFGQRRVTFLLRKTCNCCSPGGTTQGLDWGEEMTAMNGG